MTSTAVVRHALLRVSSRRIPTVLPALATVQDRRWFSRKGAKMGHHLETLEELAHRDSHEKAKERRKAKKLQKKQRHEENTSEVADLHAQDEIPDEVEFDDEDHHFDHGR